VPFEIYELTSSVSVLKVLTLVINVAIVLYLLVSKRLFGIRGGGGAEQAERDADTGLPALKRAAPYLTDSKRPSPAVPQTLIGTNGAALESTRSAR
jgi:uncharacterized membrane protein (DUF2068 family)